MFIMCVMVLWNTIFRFTEISNTHRNEFSNEQNKARRDKREEAFQEMLQ